MLDLAVRDNLQTTFYIPGLNRRLDLLQEPGANAVRSLAAQ